MSEAAAYFNKKSPLGTYGLLLLLSVPLFFLSISDEHSWGDDFAQYIKEALNIAQGKPFYTSGYIYNPYNPLYAPPQYPPGFPLLLAPVVRYFGVAIRPMLYFNSLLCAVLILTAYKFFKQRMGALKAVLLSLAVGYSNYIINLKGNVLSDLPCLILILLYLIVRTRSRPAKIDVLWLILISAAAVQMRSQAFLLFVAEGLGVLVLIWNNRLKIKEKGLLTDCMLPFLVIINSTGLCWLLNKGIFPTTLPTESFYTHYLRLIVNHDPVQLMRTNVPALYHYISGYFFYRCKAPFLNDVITALRLVGFLFCVFGFVSVCKKKAGIAEYFFVVMCLLVLSMPVQDWRYFLPAMPLVFFYTVTGLGAVMNLAGRAMHTQWIIAGFCIYMISGFDFFVEKVVDPCPGGVPTQREVQAFDHLKNYISDTDIIAFAKPRFLTFYTNVHTVNMAPQSDMAANKRFMDSLGVRYILVVDHLDDAPFRMLKAQYTVRDSIQIAPTYWLYKIR